jgi:cyclopropane-fatty-acyl-phospholipid synthase
MLNRLLNFGAETWAAGIRKSQNLPIRIELWTGKQFDLGAFATPEVRIIVRDQAALSLLFEPTLGKLVEAYVAERIDVDGSIETLISLARRFRNSNTHSSADASNRINVLHYPADRLSIRYQHDVSNDFYRLWLDRDLIYSCGYFETGNETLDLAQQKKVDLVLRKLRLEPDQTLLDLQCGWGSLVIEAARQYGVRCVGLAQSEPQYQCATERVRAAGLSDKVEVRIADLKKLHGTFDRIANVGATQKIALLDLQQHFTRIASLLSDDGVFFNQCLTTQGIHNRILGPARDGFMDRYVIPSSDVAHISTMIAAMQEAGFETIDVENLRRHYARTVREWSDRYQKESEAIRLTVGETKYRMWKVYLAASAYAASTGSLSVHQIVCQKETIDTGNIPWSRRFIYEPKRSGSQDTRHSEPCLL